ncbi:hypothetical protein Tco_0779503 [Tanacetum coccineum]
MGEPLSPNCVFDFLVDELEPHPAYDFFAPRPLPGDAGNPNNNNGWLEADDYLLGELEAMVDEPMVVPAIEEVAEPVAEVEVEQVIAPIVDMEEDLADLFGDDDFKDDASYGFVEEGVWVVNKEWLMAPTTSPPMLAVPPLSVYKVGGPSTAAAEGPSFPYSASGLPVPPYVIEDLSTSLGNLEYEHGKLVITSQMVHATDRWQQVGAQVERGQQTAAQRDEAVAELTQQVQALQAAVQQRDTQIQQLQTTVLEMGSRESILMRCILGLEMRLVELERRPPGPSSPISSLF